ncbi:MoaD/ThiS family protein [Desulfallas thermosapovorans]|uniref:Sulfur carrier protein ThiS n=1 Tax=Desulfallas thermosapovorans DSM 6562 TaxID=1121431 RepID=A0A5S4ZW51_9FIRM|nr:MoaD/ThiS family protein [Desulfallas thermosapovorans]TYO97227.1 sulfur carrier protein ThiS [Desulfallas thermosapovorans DSM 6562]
MLQVEVRVFSGLEKFLPGVGFGQPLPVELPAGATIRDLLHKIGVPEDQVFTVLVDGRHQTLDYTTTSGERISLFPPVGGG